MMLNWRNLPEDDYFLCAQCFHTAAKKLAWTVAAERASDFNACPMLFMYRQAVLLYLKVLILGPGRNFLPTKPDELSVHKSRSVSWLAQFVSQIVMALKWEGEFKCEGMENQGDFKALIGEVNAIDPAFHAFWRPGERAEQRDTGLAVLDFVRRLDSLLELLDRTRIVHGCTPVRGSRY
jgi:hypothetical protein